MNTIALYDELMIDPMGLGYPSLLNVSDNAVADMINATSGPGAATIPLPQQTKGVLLLGITPAMDRLSAGLDTLGAAIPANIVAKWQQRAALLMAADSVITLSPRMLGMLGELVTDELMTQADIDAMTKRLGSRAEVLWGAGVSVTPVDVRRALEV